MQTENTYVETDLGNIALNLRGEYSDETSYEYLDTVSYKGGSYVCLAELAKTTSGIAPEPGKNTEHWQMLTLPGQLTPEAIAMHDDVVNKAKQVETSRAAVELSQTEVEAAQADVQQMRQDTQEAAEQAIASRDGAAGYAQSAEASRTAAAESEQNINAQVTGFDTHVAEKTSAAESAIIEARQTAVNTVSAKQGDAVQAVTGEGNKQIKNVEDAGTEQVGKVKSAGASAVSTAGAAGVSAVNAVKTQQTASIKVVADKGTQQVTAVNTAGSTQASIIETKGADQVKAIQEAGENALQNISNGVDKGLSEEGKAADAKVTGEAIGKLTENIDDCLKVKYLELKQDNLINIDNLTVGLCDSDGSFKDNTRYKRTDYEFVKPNTTYSSWRMIWRNELVVIRATFFDKNKKFIRGDRDIGNIFTTPSDAYYVILTYLANENITEERMPMACEGKNVPEVYLPYKNEYITKVVEYVKKDDLKPHAYMPDVIYCALGRTIDIYNNQVYIDADKFHLCWTCDIGFGEGRKFTVAPSTIGNHSLKLDIYDDNNILVWTKTSTLKVVNAKTSGSITILPIGDSMTYGGATWQDEVSKKLSNGAITYVGSLEHSYRETNYNHEGYNGATASNFLNSKMLRDLTNPFYNPDTSKFDWNYYKNNTRISPDVVQIELGTNDINGGTIEQAVSNVAEMVDLIRKDDANIPIFICNAIYRSNQNGIAHQLSTQGYSMGNGVYKYGEDIKIQSLMVSLVEKFTDYKNVYFIPLALCHDSENNFGKQKISLNSRSKETIIIPADSIHPNKTGEDASIYGYDIVGYLQFADIMFSTFSGLIN